MAGIGSEADIHSLLAEMKEDAKESNSNTQTKSKKLAKSADEIPRQMLVCLMVKDSTGQLKSLLWNRKNHEQKNWFDCKWRELCSITLSLCMIDYFHTRLQFLHDGDDVPEWLCGTSWPDASQLVDRHRVRYWIKNPTTLLMNNNQVLTETLGYAVYGMCFFSLAFVTIMSLSYRHFVDWLQVHRQFMTMVPSHWTHTQCCSNLAVFHPKRR